MKEAFLCGLEKAPTFLVPIINPPFADNSPHLFPPGEGGQTLVPILHFMASGIPHLSPARAVRPPAGDERGAGLPYVTFAGRLDDPLSGRR
jgi:hypothetical protein